MKTISDNSVVAFHCDILDLDGNHLQTSRSGLPRLFLYGDDSIPSALQKAMHGSHIGDRLKVQLLPEQAYGERDPELVQALPASYLPEDANLSIGDIIVAHTEEGDRPVKIVDMCEKQITLDGNHPLSGKTLLFDIEIKHIRHATEKELAKKKAIP